MPWKSFLSLEVKFASVCLWLEILVQGKVKNIKVAKKSKLYTQSTCSFHTEHTGFRTVWFEGRNGP